MFTFSLKEEKTSNIPPFSKPVWFKFILFEVSYFTFSLKEEKTSNIPPFSKPVWFKFILFEVSYFTFSLKEEKTSNIPPFSKPVWFKFQKYQTLHLHIPNGLWLWKYNLSCLRFHVSHLPYRRQRP